MHINQKINSLITKAIQLHAPHAAALNDPILEDIREIKRLMNVEQKKEAIARLQKLQQAVQTKTQTLTLEEYYLYELAETLKKLWYFISKS